MMITKVLKSLVAFLLLKLTVTSASIFNNATCNSNKTFTPNSTFHANLKILLSSLSSNATGDLRFFNTTAGKQHSDDTVYGLFMCRGDVAINLCRECIGFATQTIASSCSSSKEAVIWYNECLLRYSYRFIFSNTETIPRYKIQIPMGDPKLLQSQRFYTALKSILNHLPKEAALSLSGANKYAVKQENASASITLYGLAQCTPDLSAADCTRCVKAAAAVFPQSCCGGSIGEMVLFPSCIVRYETYPFYQHSGNSVVLSIKGERNIPRHVIVIIVVLVVTLVMLFCFGCCLIWIKARRRRKATLKGSLGLEINNSESLQFDFATIEIATNKFSPDHKIGRGGYGAVYKGILPGGQEIAVKRLSKNSGQGGVEFKNEVMLIAKLQHRNLVRLIGFCLDDQEKILVYEYVTNKSLDHFLFDPLKQKQLTWLERFDIIKGIARGILYLHEDSRLKIIHRDIKPSNVLLDNNMNPKISDFGLARMVTIEQIQGTTNRVVGTYGYMSPEYAMHGQFSVKSDVFSFGVMVLEIISGKRNSCSFESSRLDDLLSYAWNQWKGESPFELLDPILLESYSSANEIERCMQIGLLCVQENPDDRPTMGTIVSYLNNMSLEMPFPLEPAFFMQGRTRRHTSENESYSGHSTNRSFSSSANMMSTSNFFPR